VAFLGDPYRRLTADESARGGPVRVYTLALSIVVHIAVAVAIS
jgi:hypothetical protein